ncbi:hypothetical protein SAMN02982929_03437 [Saccharopolyspora kobensis]|uniref:Uncharacterized protein n=1 Tax=Saccharopolyspora kobensis TaxID=146035 RepID=A0A1H6CSF0_9PSEU|nr:hypothetical protein [Saccharopolyspora kobensis]SEG75336.1 hypothetical protein SAMN02982929_03437 [Saccharopolyspora kobensis]SFC96117.1 hypothetical protein SAMN05216506_10230 [Saccharopolyspora kobensis]
MSGGLVRRWLSTSGRPPHEIAAAEPPERLAAALVRNLAEGTGGRAAYAVPTERSHVVVESWPPGLSGVAGAAGAERVGSTGGALFVIAPSKWDDAARALLRDTAGWLDVAVQLARLHVDHAAADQRARRLNAELNSARARLARVRDLERHRLVQAITATTLRDLDEVRKSLRAVTDDGAELTTAEGVLEELIDDFRAVVRGVFPAMLPDRGPRAALEELAATLPRAVTFKGDLGRRAGWQLESGFYHAVAAALNLLAGEESARPLTVTFGRDDALRARIHAPDAPAEAQLRYALGQDVERLAVLGGDMECAAVDGAAVITVRLAERVELAPPAVDPAELERSAVYRKVRELVRQGQIAVGGAPGRAAWDAVAERLTMPPRLAVVGPGGEIKGGTLASIIVFDTPADRELAEELRADDDPRGGVDGVLCRVPAAPEFREVLLSGRNRVVLAESGSVGSLAARLAAHGPVIAARRAVVAMRDLVRGLPAGHQLRWAVEQVSADAHEFAELDLLDDLERGGVLRAVAAAATRLLGADGIDPRTRLGLPPEATDEDVVTAARAAVTRWRAHAEHPANGSRDRAACEVLVRTAEGLLAPKGTAC